jgi:hypothetical protein
MREYTFEEMRAIERGCQIEVRLHGQRVIAGTFLGIAPGRESGTVRQRQAALGVRYGAIIEHLREDDVCAIRADARRARARR